jgi:hypothetical protein
MRMDGSMYLSTFGSRSCRLSLAASLCIVAAAEQLSGRLALLALTISTALTVLLATSVPVGRKKRNASLYHRVIAPMLC